MGQLRSSNHQLAHATFQLEKIFSGPDYREAHASAAPVLAGLGADPELLADLVKDYVLSDSFNGAIRINPVVAIPMIESEKFTLVANIWIPRPDGRTDISHQSIHHHGNLLLTSISAFGPGYESIIFNRIEAERGQEKMEIRQVYRNEAGKVEFIDAGVPHIVFYPAGLSVTYALWSKDRPYRLSRFRLAPKSLKVAARALLGWFGLSRAFGFNQENNLDFTVKNGEIVALSERALYRPGTRSGLVEALRFIAAEIDVQDDEVWRALGGRGETERAPFETDHLLLPEANLVKEEVMACFR